MRKAQRHRGTKAQRGPVGTAGASPRHPAVPSLRRRLGVPSGQPTRSSSLCPFVPSCLRASPRTRPQGFATVIVLLAMAIATVVLVGLQGSAFRQAAAGREEVGRVRAYWAARAALESQISALSYHVQQGQSTSAYALYNDMDAMASGSLEGAEFEIVRTENGDERVGVEDAHAKININRMTQDDLMELPNMTEDMAAAILDWIDEDDSVRELGAEKGYYAQLPTPYEPRNGPIQSLRELELVAGVRPEYVRGEDWNLNGRLDPNENDGDATWPDDNADDKLDAGWSEWITTESVDEGIAYSGDARLNLLTADEKALLARLEELDPLQARVIIDYARRQGARLEDLISTPLVALATQVVGLGAPPTAVANLTGDQLGKLLEEATLYDPDDGPVPGRLNVNTADREEYKYIPEIPSGLADQIVFARDSRPEGFTSLLDLLDVVSPQTLTQLSIFLDVRSTSFVVSARGRDVNTGIEVDLVATIDRTGLPITISEMSVR